jgi:hypothetical protein
MSMMKRRAGESGIVLVTVIWVLLILTVIAWTYARQCQMELRMTGYQTNSIRAYYLAKAGVARAMVYLREDKLKDHGVLGREDLIKVDEKDENYLYDAPSESWGFNPDAYGINPDKKEDKWGAEVENARGKILVKVEDLSGRININSANYEQIRHLLQVCGVDEKQAQALGAAIVDFVDNDDQPTLIDETDIPGWEYGDQSNEDYYYNPHQAPEEIDNSGPSNAMKNEPMAAVEELLLVPHMTSLIYYGEDENHNGELDDNEDDGDESPPNDNADGKLQLGIRDYLTVQAGLSTEKVGKTNLNSAPLEVIQALFWGEDESGDDAMDVAEKIVKYRDGGDEVLGSDDDRKFRTLPHSDENKEGIDSVGLDPSEISRAASMFGVASDYFIVHSTGIVNDVKKTLNVTVLRVFKEEAELNDAANERFKRDQVPEEQVKFLVISFEEEG